MDISNSAATSTAVSQLVNQNFVQPSPPRTEKASNSNNVNEQGSSVVKLSAQAQQLLQAEKANEAQNTNQTNKVAEPAGIQFISGDSKGGKVNTFA